MDSLFKSCAQVLRLGMTAGLSMTCFFGHWSDMWVEVRLFSMVFPILSDSCVVFFSTDTTLERNTLMAEAYPRLKDYCRERHGLEFQVSTYWAGQRLGRRWVATPNASKDDRLIVVFSIVEQTYSNAY